MEGSNGVGDKGGPPPPSPLTGCYLLLVIGEPHTDQHKDIILQRIAKGLLSWDVGSSLVDLEKELAIVTEKALDGEEARYGERLIQFASENLITEILIHPVVSTLAQCMRNLLSSFTRHRHMIHAGYTFAANGSWALQDGTFSYVDFCEAFQELEVQRVIRAYENGISLDLHCSPEGDWTKLPMESFTKYCKVKVNPTDVLASGSAAINSFINYLSPFLMPTSLDSLLERSDVVGNIRFSRPTLYVFPGGQGDAALFGINGFNMLLDGGYSRKACFWDFVRHLDRLDAVLMTRLNNSNVGGISSVLRRKRQDAVYPQIGHFFCNIQERKALPSPDGDKDKDPLLINLMDEGQEIVSNLRHLGMNPQVCYRDSEPINLYHKVGHGTLDMYVLSPSRDAKEVREFLQKWNQSDQKLFANSRFSRDFSFPIQNLVSIAALLVWQPANPTDTITRILFPGSSPHKKIFEGLDRLKNLEFIKHAVCTEKSLTPVSITKKNVITEKLALKEKEKVLAEKKTNNLIENNMPAVNGEVKEKTVKKSDSTESERSTKLKKLDDSKIAIENEDKQKPKLKPSKPRSNSQQRKKPLQQKASPTTPKKITENEDVKKPSKPSPISTPAKSAKDANNRKVIESKTRQAAAAVAAKPPTIVEAKAKPERKPISRRPKAMKAPISPVKKLVNGVQKPDSISKKGRLDKEGTTDSSTVSTPSADQDSMMKKDISKLTPEEIQQMKAQELADLKEEQEAIKEIEAVFRKGETHTKDNENIRKIKDISIEEKLEKEEYLIIEKEELLQDSIDEKEPKEDETQKLARDSEESEKQQKLSADENVIGKIPEIQDQVNGIVTGAEDILKCKEENIETSKLTSPEEKLESTDKKTTDKDVEEEVKDVVESQPDEKVSVNIKSGDTTTAPTLPEDERIPLDEIKEDNGLFIEEKHVKEDTKEKEVPMIQLPPKPFETIGKLPNVVGIRLDKQTHIRDIVKTPDEVADLPVHEEVDYEYTHDVKSEVGKTNEIQEKKIELGDDTLKYTKEQVKEVEQEKDKDDVIQEEMGNVEDLKKPSSVQEELKNLTDTVLKNESVLEKDILKESEKDHPVPLEKLEGMPEDPEHVKSQKVKTATESMEKEKQVTEVKIDKELSGFEEKLSELRGISDEQGIEKHDEEKPEHTDKQDRDDKDEELDLINAVEMQTKMGETKYDKETAPVTTLHSKDICDQEEQQRDKHGQLEVSREKYIVYENVEHKSDVKEEKIETCSEKDREAVMPEVVIQFDTDIPENKEVPDDEPLKYVTPDNFKEKEQEVKSYQPDFEDKPTIIEKEDVALSINLMLKDEGHHQTSVQEQKFADLIRESPETSESEEKGEAIQDKKEIGHKVKYDIKIISKNDEQQTGAEKIESIEVPQDKMDSKKGEAEAGVQDVIQCKNTSEFAENNKAVKMGKDEPLIVDKIQVEDEVSKADGQTDEKKILHIEETAKKIEDKIDEIRESGVVNEIPTNKGHVEELIISEKLQKQPENLQLSSDTDHLSHLEAIDSCLEPVVDRKDMSKEEEGNDDMDNIEDDICEDKLGKDQIEDIQSDHITGEMGDKMKIADGGKFSDLTEKVDSDMAKYINEDVKILTQKDHKHDELGLGNVDVIAVDVDQKIKSSECKENQQESEKRDDTLVKISDEDRNKSEQEKKEEHVIDTILSEEVEHHTEGEKISSQIQKREQSPILEVGALGDKLMSEKDHIVLKEVEEKDLSQGKEIKISQQGSKIQELGPKDEGVEKDILIDDKEHRNEEVIPVPGDAKNEEKHIVNDLNQPKQAYESNVLLKSGKAEMDKDVLEHEHESMNVKDDNEDNLSPQELKDSSLVEKKKTEEVAEVRSKMKLETEESMEISKKIEVEVSKILSEDKEKEYKSGYGNSKSTVEKSEAEGVTTPLDVYGENITIVEDKKISEKYDQIEKTTDITDKELLDKETNEMVIEKKIHVNTSNEEKPSGTGENEIDLKTSVDETQVAEVKHGELETYKVDGMIKPIEQTVEKYSIKGSPEKGENSESKEIFDNESETKNNIDIKEIKATAELIERMELGRKSPKEREEDVIKIVASVAEVLKSDAPLEEFEGKLPISTFSPYSSSFTTELRETHITTVDSPTVESKLIRSEIKPSITEEPHCGSASFIEEERKIAAVHIADEDKLVKADDKRSNLLKESQELLMATSKMISDIKTSKMEEIVDGQECEKLDEEDSGTVHRMLVTASSEDGGEETEICPAGSITFSKSSESSGRSSPEQSQKLSQKSSIVDTFSDSLSTVRQIVDSGIYEIKSDAEEETMDIQHVSQEADKSEEVISQTISGKSTPDVSTKSLAFGQATPDIFNLDGSKDVDDPKKSQEYSKNEGDVYQTYMKKDLIDMNKKGRFVEENEDKIKDSMEAESNKENQMSISGKPDDSTSQTLYVEVVGTISETDQKTEATEQKIEHDLNTSKGDYGEKKFQEVEQNGKQDDSKQKLTTQYDTAEYVGRDDKLKIDTKDAGKQDDASARDKDSIIGKVAITAIETIGEGFETIKEESTKAIASLKGITEADLQESEGIEKISQMYTDKKDSCDTKKSDIGSWDSQCHSGFKVISPEKSDSGGGNKTLIPSAAATDNCEQEIYGLVSKSEHTHSNFSESTHILQASITVEADSIKNKTYDRAQNLEEHLNDTAETIKKKVDETDILASSKYTKDTLEKKSVQIESQIKSSEEKNMEPAQSLKGDMIDNKDESLKMVTDIDNDQRKSESVASDIKEDIFSDTKTVGKIDNVGEGTPINFESTEISKSIAKDLTDSDEAETSKKESIVEKIEDTVISTTDYSLGKSILSKDVEIMEDSVSNIENTTESIVDMIEGTLKDVVSFPVDKPGSKVEPSHQMESQELEDCKQMELSETKSPVISTKQLTSDNKAHWRQDKSDDTDDKESQQTESALEVVDNKVGDITKSDKDDEISFEKEKFDEEKGVDKVEQLTDSKVSDVKHEDEKTLIGELDSLEKSAVDIEKAYEKVSEISKSIQFEKCDKASEKGEKKLDHVSDIEETRDTIEHTSKYVVFEKCDSKPTKLETGTFITKAVTDVKESFEVVCDMSKSIVYEKYVKDAEKEKSDKEKEYVEDKTDTVSEGRKSPVIKIKADEKVVGQIVDTVAKEVSTKSIEAELQMNPELLQSGKGIDLESKELEKDENEKLEKAKKEVDIMCQSTISSDPDLKDLDFKVVLPPTETKTLANVGDSKIEKSLVTLDVTEPQGKKLSISELDISFTEEISDKEKEKSVIIKAEASVKENSGIEFRDTLSHEKHIPGAVTPPTVPVSPNMIDNCGEEKRLTTKTDTLIKELALRSSTPASDDFEILTSTHSDISFDNASKIPLDIEKVESDYEEEDQLSVTSQAAHSRDSSHYEFEDDSKKIDPMSISFYGTLPGDSTVELTHLYEITKAKYSGKQTDEACKENRQLSKCSESDKSSSDQYKGERDSLGNPLRLPPPPLPTYLYEITKAKYSSAISLSTSTEEDDHVSYSSRQMDMMTVSFYGDLPTEEDECDVIQNWGKPLGLPSPAPPTDNKGTPKKDRKLSANVTAKNKLNDDKKRAESPSKYNKNKKITPVYVDLTYVPHHGNTYYSFVDFFRRIRARYYVFSGIEPSREVYNALLEAKQTWEEKDLEVTIIPTYDTDILGYWVAENEDLLMKYKIDLSPSASRCTINLQDHETSCSAYRLEF